MRDGVVELKGLKANGQILMRSAGPGFGRFQIPFTVEDDMVHSMARDARHPSHDVDRSFVSEGLPIGMQQPNEFFT